MFYSHSAVMTYEPQIYIEFILGTSTSIPQFITSWDWHFADLALALTAAQCKNYSQVVI